MKRTHIAAALLSCAVAAPVVAAEYYYYYPAGTTVVTPVAAPVVSPMPSQVVYYNDQTTISIVQQRLLAAGYTVRADGVLDSATIDALRHFQQSNGIVVTGSIDAPTMAALGLNRGMSGSVGGVPVIVSTPVIISPRVDSLPRNSEGSPGDNVGGIGGHTNAYWSSKNY